MCRRALSFQPVHENLSVLRTCWQQGKDAFARMVSLLRTPQAVTLDIVPGSGYTALNPPSIPIPCLTP